MSDETTASAPQETAIKRDEHGRILPGSGPLNPGGRPKGSVSLKTIMLRKLAEDPARAERIVSQWLNKAEAGEFQHLKELLERVDGSVKQQSQIEVTGRTLVEVEREPDGRGS